MDHAGDHDRGEPCPLARCCSGQPAYERIRCCCVVAIQCVCSFVHLCSCAENLTKEAGFAETERLKKYALRLSGIVGSSRLCCACVGIRNCVSIQNAHFVALLRSNVYVQSDVRLVFAFGLCIRLVEAMCSCLVSSYNYWFVESLQSGEAL